MAMLTFMLRQVRKRVRAYLGAYVRAYVHERAQPFRIRANDIWHTPQVKRSATEQLSI